MKNKSKIVLSFDKKLKMEFPFMWVKVLKVMKVITVIPMVFDGLVALYKAAKKGIK